MKTIMIVDNSKQYLDELSENLSRANYSVLKCANEKVAKETLSKNDIDLAIVDLKLKNDADPSDKSGVDLLSYIGNQIPKILISAYPEPNIIAETLRAREGGVLAHDFIAKSLGMSTIRDSVSRTLRITEGFRRISSEGNRNDVLYDTQKELLRQVTIDHRTLTVSQILGLIFFGIGIALVYLNKIEIGILSAATGLISNLVSTFFINRMNRSTAKLSEYIVPPQKKIEDINRLLENIEKTEDQKILSELKTDLIRKLAVF